MLSVLFVTLLLQASPDSPAVTIQRARTVVRDAEGAVERDSIDVYRRRWTARPSSDPWAALGLATLDRLTYDYAQAEARYAVLRGTGEPRDAIQLYALLGTALAAAQRWQTAVAINTLHRAIAASRGMGDVAAEAEALAVLARFVARSASFDSAMALLDRAQRIMPTPERAPAALIRCGRSALLRFVSANRADSLAREGIREAYQIGDRRLLGRCYAAQAAAYEVVGRQRLASEAADSAARISESVRDLEAAAGAHQFRAYLATTYDTRFDRGRRSAETAIRLGTLSGNRLPAAWAELNLASLALRLGDVQASLRHNDRARRMLAEFGDRSGIANSHILAGDAANLLGQFDRARISYDSARAIFVALRLETWLPVVLWRLAGAERDGGDPARARSYFQEGLNEATRLKLTGLTATDQHYVRGTLALREERFGEAAGNFATFLQQFSTRTPQYLFDGRVRLAEAYARLGRLDDAVRTLEQAFLDLDAARDQLMERDARIAVLQSRRFEFDPDLGIATIVNMLARAGRVETAFRVAESQRAHHLWEQTVRRGALSNDSAQGARAARRAETVLLAEVQSQVPDSTVLLEYVTGRGGEPTTLFVISRTAARTFSLPPADSLVVDIDRFGRALEGGVRAGALARSLGTRVFGPALELIPAGASRLIIMADGPLHRLPFDALQTSSGSLLLERFAVSISPSARLAREQWSTPAAGLTDLLAFGDARFAASTQLERLEASEREAKAVAALARHGRALTGARASEAALKAADFTSIGMLHLATHARVEEWGVLTSALFLSPGDGEDGRLGVEEIAHLPLRADLVVLSACRTVGGAIVSGEGLQGLTAPFLEAGARTVIATYWPVGDRAIVGLITGVYEGLRQGLSAGAALHRAKLAAMRAGESPAIWASLTLTGDARVRPNLR